MSSLTVANSFRIFFKLLKLLKAFWSSRDHHLKAISFNKIYVSACNRWLFVLQNAKQLSLAISNLRHLQTLPDIHEFRKGFEFPHRSSNKNKVVNALVFAGARER